MIYESQKFSENLTNSNYKSTQGNIRSTISPTDNNVNFIFTNNIKNVNTFLKNFILKEVV